MNLIVNTIFLFTTLSFITFGVIGYGILFSKMFYFEKKKYFNTSYYAIFGLLFLVFISYYTNLIIAHSEIFNFLLFIIGFFYYIFYNFNEKLNLTKNVFLLVLVYFSFILISKNHDDFFYYHLSSTLNIVENKIQFGLGNLKLGYRHHSSIIYLMSLTYFPIINFYLVNSINFIVFIFTSLILYENIKKYLNKNNLITFFCLFFFILINIKFKRLSEYGTDLAAQLLIIILFLSLTKFFIEKKIKKKIYLLFFQA